MEVMIQRRTEQAKKTTILETGQSKTATNLETLVEGQNRHGSDDLEERTEQAKKTTMEETGKLKTAMNLETVVEGQNKHGSDDLEVSADKLPLLMIYNWTKTCGINILSLCDFSGLLLDHPYTVDVKRYRIERRIFIGADLLASKNGWLLLKNCDRPFLYNPFMREMINLPNLDIGSDKATLSTMSTSAECMVFVIKRSMTGDKIIISMYHCGDTEWTTYTFEGLFNCVKDVVYSKGKFYCVFLRWNVGGLLC
ncbi:hypothetical protein L1049_016616 [Liquidambar formosana]|uniref:KIB1-4 beta-propeller domain-containing protein n=1 Tax=Liquidambar formosana TaxID=63359 RepID=A0AAP0S6D5_LIQFO